MLLNRCGRLSQNNYFSICDFHMLKNFILVTMPLEWVVGRLAGPARFLLGRFDIWVQPEQIVRVPLAFQLNQPPVVGAEGRAYALNIVRHKVVDVANFRGEFLDRLPVIERPVPPLIVFGSIIPLGDYVEVVHVLPQAERRGVGCHAGCLAVYMEQGS